MSLTDKQKYYTYDQRQGGSWWIKDPPTAPDWFQKELIDLAGLSDRGQPKLRASWAGTLLHDITEKPRLKHMALRQVITGYNYKKTDGEIGRVSSMNLATDAKIPWEFVPVYKRLELGRLRWVIEIHVPKHELVKLGRFTNRRAPDGELILRELPEEGVYDHYFWVQTANYQYRDLDREVLTAIQAIWLYNTTTSEAQLALDDIERQKNQPLIGANDAMNIWQGLT